MGEEYCLTVSGRVTPLLTLSMEDLRRMDIVETAAQLKMICGEGDVKGTIGTCRGVLLTDIINLTEVIAPEHNDTKKTYVVVASKDKGHRTGVSERPMRFAGPSMRSSIFKLAPGCRAQPNFTC